MCQNHMLFSHTWCKPDFKYHLLNLLIYMNQKQLLFASLGHIKHSRVASPTEKEVVQMWVPSLKCIFVSHTEKSMQLLNITHILSAGTCQTFWLQVLKKPHCIFSFVEICLLDAYPVPFMIWKHPPCSHSALNQIAMASTQKINQNSFYTNL